MKNKDIVAAVVLTVVLSVILTVAGWARADHAELHAGLVELHAGLVELHERMGRIEAALEEHLHKP